VVVIAWAPGYTRMPVIYSSPDGGVLQGEVTADFAGAFALDSAFRDTADRATLSGLPVRLSPRTRVVHLWGTTGVPLESRLAMILPGGGVKTAPLRQRGAHFDAVARFERKGTYWVEINATSGFAVFNVLVFRGEAPHPPLEPTFPAEPAWGQVTPQQLAGYGLYILNNVRQTMGRRPLTMDPRLRAAAAAHDEDLIRYGYYPVHPHIGSDGSTPWRRMAAAGYRVHTAGEAVGEGVTVADVVTGFLESAAHRAVLLGRYSAAGFAVTQAGGQLMVTIDLAR
jgi:uncharacterized protein YkwD